jgi:hypothetical protein
MSDSTSTTIPSQIATRALELCIGRHYIPLSLMDPVPNQRRHDPSLVQEIYTGIRDAMTSDARTLWPMRVILTTKDENAINAIRHRQDLSDSQFRFLILDGQHRYRAAVKFLEEARRNLQTIKPEFLHWNCEVFRYGNHLHNVL